MIHVYFSSVSQSVQSLSRVQLFVTPWIAARQASLSITKSQGLLKLMSIESVMPSRYLILCHPLLLLSPIPPSIRVFSNESALLTRWPKYWGFSLSISLSNEYSRLISLRMDWLDLLAVQGTCKSLFQHHSSKASILQRSAFFTVQLSHPYTTTGKTIALTRWSLVGKVLSLLLNMLSRLVIAFLPTSSVHFWQSGNKIHPSLLGMNSVSFCLIEFDILFLIVEVLRIVMSSWRTDSFIIMYVCTLFYPDKFHCIEICSVWN